jgi:hypothetical protein
MGGRRPCLQPQTGVPRGQAPRSTEQSDTQQRDALVGRQQRRKRRLQNITKLVGEEACRIESSIDRSLDGSQAVFDGTGRATFDDPFKPLQQPASPVRRKSVVKQNEVFDATSYGRDHVANALPWMQLILASNLERSGRRIESRAKKVRWPAEFRVGPANSLLN